MELKAQLEICVVTVVFQNHIQKSACGCRAFKSNLEKCVIFGASARDCPRALPFFFASGSGFKRPIRLKDPGCSMWVLWRGATTPPDHPRSYPHLARSAPPLWMGVSWAESDGSATERRKPCCISSFTSASFHKKAAWLVP